MKKTIIILIAVVSSLTLLAQNRDLKNWSDGPLTWNDFKGKTVIKGTPSYLKVSLNSVSNEELTDKKLQYRITANAVMDRNESYADTLVRTERRLRYHQLQFDQLELFRRRLQNDLSTGMNGLEADKRLAYYQNLYKDQIETIRMETEDGNNDKKLQEWEYYTRKGLEEIGLPPAPEFVPSDWSYGVYLGIGGVYPNSDIKDYFGSCFSFTAGLTGGYKRLKLKADISYGQSDFNKPNVFGVKDSQGRDLQGPMNEYATYLGVGTNLGYSLVDSKRIAVTPFVGMYWSGYNWNMANLKWEEDPETKEWVSKVASTENAKLKDFSWIAGIDFDIKLHTYVSSTPFFLTGQREQFTSSVRITPFIAHAKFNEIGVKGYHIGFTISYSGIARSLKMK